MGAAIVPISARVVETAADEEGRNEGIVHPRHFGDREERGFEDDGADRGLGREPRGDGRPQRLAEEHDPVGREAALPRRAEDRAGIAGEAVFRRGAGRAAVAAVVDEKDVEAEALVQDPGAVEAVRRVAGVPVKEQDRALPGAADPPARERLAVLGREGERVRAQAVRLRRRRQLPHREVEERVLEAHDDGENTDDGRGEDGGPRPRNRHASRILSRRRD